jgi:hypothetical protein
MECVCVCERERERERERKEYVYVERESQNKGWHAPHYASHTMCCTTHYQLPSTHITLPTTTYPKTIMLLLEGAFDKNLLSFLSFLVSCFS